MVGVKKAYCDHCGTRVYLYKNKKGKTIADCPECGERERSQLGYNDSNSSRLNKYIRNII